MGFLELLLLEKCYWERRCSIWEERLGWIGGGGGGGWRFGGGNVNWYYELCISLSFLYVWG